MMRTKHLRGVVAAVTLMGLSACAEHTWAPGPGASVPINMAQGRCKLVAMGMDTGGGGFEAQGSTKFVAAATAGYLVGSAIGSAVRQNASYNACMEASGFVAVDGQQAAAAGVPSVAAASPPPTASQPAVAPVVAMAPALVPVAAETARPLGQPPLIPDNERIQ